MKKLISILGALSISASTTFAVVACGDPATGDNGTDETADFDQSQMTEFLGEVSKAAYLNKNNEYNMDYILDTYAYSNSTSKAMSGSDLKAFKEKYFKNGLVSSDVTSITDGKQPADKDLLLKITNIVSSIFSVKKDGDNDNLEEVVKGILESFGVSLDDSTLTEEVKATIKKVGDSLTSFGSALNMEKYVGKTWTDAMNLSLVELADGVIKLSGETSNYLSTINDSNYEQTFTEAMSKFGAAAAKLALNPLESGQILENLTALTSIVNFARMALLYVSSFIVNEDLSTSLDFDTISSFRKETISVDDNSIDLKTLLDKAQDILFSTTSGDNTEAPELLRNVVKMLFVSNETDYTSDMILDLSSLGENLEDLLSSLLGGDGDLSGIVEKIGLKKFNEYSFKKGNFGFSFAAAQIINKLDIGAILEKLIPGVGSLIAPLLEQLNLNLGNIAVNIIGKIALKKPILTKSSGTLLGTLYDTLNGFIKLPFTKDVYTKLIDSLSSSSDDNSSANGDLLSLVWNNDISGYGSIQSILTGDLTQLFGIDNVLGFEFLDNMKSFKSIIEQIQTLVKDKKASIDFTQISTIISSLGPVFSNMPTNVADIVKAVRDQEGLVDNLIKARDDMNGLYEISNWVNEQVSQQKQDLVSAIKTAYSSLKIVDAQAVSTTKYNYNFGQGRKLSVTIKKVSGTYIITTIE